jgi:hypothetical protein
LIIGIFLDVSRSDDQVDLGHLEASCRDVNVWKRDQVLKFNLQDLFIPTCVSGEPVIGN